MSGVKLSYSLTDEQSDMRKQVGCMAGILQLLDRRRLLAGDRRRNNKKLLTGSQHNMDLKSMTKSKMENTVQDEPKDEQITPNKPPNLSSLSQYRKTLQLGTKSADDLQQLVKESMYREARSVSVKALSIKVEGKQRLLKRIDSPRPLKQCILPSYSVDDNRADTLHISAKYSHRFSCDGIERPTTKIKDFPRLSLDSRIRSASESKPNLSVVAKLMGLDSLPADSIPKKEGELVRGCHVSMSSRPAQQSVFGEIEKRVAELEFKKSGKDLRALKHILEAMHKTTTPILESQKQETPRKNNVKQPSHYQCVEKRRNGRVSKPNQSPKTPEKMIRDHNHIEVMKRGKDRGSQLSELSKIRGNQSRRQKPKPVILQLDDDRSSDHSTDSRNLIAAMDAKKQGGAKEWLGMSEAAMALTTEQPSPVSVLDASFYTEDSPSPVKKKSTAFTEHDPADANEAEWQTEDLVCSEYSHKSLADIQHLMFHHQIEFFCQSNNLDHQYICNILLASGILKDSEHISTTIELHPSGYLINPELFHVLEQAHRENPLQLCRKTHRKVIFDTVNEILVHKLYSKGSSIPRRRCLSGQQLVKELCTEIYSLRPEPNCRSSVFDDDELVSVIYVDMKHDSEDWEKHHCEIPGLVLNIERLIFKDLITEVIRGDGSERSRGHCRQLFTKYY